MPEALRLKVPFQTHAAQSIVEFHEITRRHGMTPIEWLDSLGVLGPQAATLADAEGLGAHARSIRIRLNK